MKSFDEWLEENYNSLDTIEDHMKFAKEVWQAAQDIQRKSDAEVFMNKYNDDNATGADIYLEIFNNRT